MDFSLVARAESREERAGAVTQRHESLLISDHVVNLRVEAV